MIGALAQAHMRPFPALRFLCLHILGEHGRQSAVSGGAEGIPVISHQYAKGGVAQSHRLFEHRIEHGGEVGGRTVDDLQHLRGRGLLLQRLAEVAVAALQFAEQSGVLDGDSRLVGKSLEELDLGGSERLDRAPTASDDPDRPPLTKDRHPEE